MKTRHDQPLTAAAVPSLAPEPLPDPQPGQPLPPEHHQYARELGWGAGVRGQRTVEALTHAYKTPMTPFAKLPGYPLGLHVDEPITADPRWRNELRRGVNFGASPQPALPPLPPTTETPQEASDEQH